MSGNSFGKLFVVTTAGESHGPAYVAIIDGCPPGLSLSEYDIQLDLNRRKPGTSRNTTQRKELDRVRILSGVFKGKTTGTPISLLVENHDFLSSDYLNTESVFRPGHADYTYFKKYGVRDHRGGGRSSARETLMRVASGSIAKKYLKKRYGLTICAYLSQMDDIVPDTIDLNFINQNSFFFPDELKLSLLEKKIALLKRTGDSVGARIQLIASQVPVGLGEPVFDKLEADISAAMMSINAVKAVEIGDGFSVISQRGSDHRDEISTHGFHSNHAGGTLGGISSGQDLSVSVALKPTSSIRARAKTVNLSGQETEIVIEGRHDPCVGIRAVPVVEAMMALVLMDHVLRDRAQNIDVHRG